MGCEQTEAAREELRQFARLQVFKVAIQEGLDSGESDRTVPQIMEEVERRLQANGRL